MDSDFTKVVAPDRSGATFFFFHHHTPTHMVTFRTFIISLTLLLCTGFLEKGTWVIDPDSRLSIHGVTNINTFTCAISCYTQSDTLEYTRNDRSCELLFSRDRMTIPIRDFDCGTRQITKDFHETLKSKTYPYVDIRFKSLNNLSMRDNAYTRGVIDITIAGVTRRYVVGYHATIRGEDLLLLNGEQRVNFSDFGLRAPNKMMGMIRVEESVTVEFNLALRVISP